MFQHTDLLETFAHERANEMQQMMEQQRIEHKLAHQESKRQPLEQLGHALVSLGTRLEQAGKHHCAELPIQQTKTGELHA